MRKEKIDDLEIYCFEWEFIDSMMYAVFEGEKALVIDPLDTNEIRSFFATRNIENIMIVLTHEHFDHINGVNWLKETYGAKVYGNASCAKNVENKSKNLSDKSEVLLMFNPWIRERNIDIVPFVCTCDCSFDDEMELSWQGHTIDLHTTPGHTQGSICVLVDKKVLFTGDTLLAIPTITRLPGGSRKDFLNITIPWLESISDLVQRVYPGHGQAGELIEMLAVNREKK